MGQKGFPEARQQVSLGGGGGTSALRDFEASWARWGCGRIPLASVA